MPHSDHGICSIYIVYDCRGLGIPCPTVLTEPNDKHYLTTTVRNEKKHLNKTDGYISWQVIPTKHSQWVNNYHSARLTRVPLGGYICIAAFPFSLICQTNRAMKMKLSLPFWTSIYIMGSDFRNFEKLKKDWTNSKNVLLESLYRFVFF